MIAWITFSAYKQYKHSVLFASAPIHIVLIGNNTISLVSRNVPQSVFCQIQCRGQAAAALCICSKQYINNYGYSAERQHKETKAGVLTEHPNQELESWKESLGRHLPVVDCTVLCTSPWGLGWCCSVWFRELKELLLSCFIMYFSLEVSKEYKPHITLQESLDSGDATQIMETLVSYQNVGRRFLYCLTFLEASKNKLWVLTNWGSTERRAACQSWLSPPDPTPWHLLSPTCKRQCSKSVWAINTC